MKVRDCNTIRKVDPETGAVTFETEERWLEIDGILTEDEAKEQERLQAIRDANAAIQAQLAANDLTIIRALAEGDAARVAAHKVSQAALRAKLKPVI